MKTGRATINTNKSKTKDLLLCHPNFVAKSVDASFGPLPLACEADRRKGGNPLPPFGLDYTRFATRGQCDHHLCFQSKCPM
jgi:hypothetical protein